LREPAGRIERAGEGGRAGGCEADLLVYPVGPSFPRWVRGNAAPTLLAAFRQERGLAQVASRSRHLRSRDWLTVRLSYFADATTPDFTSRVSDTGAQAVVRGVDPGLRAVSAVGRTAMRTSPRRALAAWSGHALVPAGTAAERVSGTCQRTLHVAAPFCMVLHAAAPPRVRRVVPKYLIYSEK
jgi:hypothetical protein